MARAADLFEICAHPLDAAVEAGSVPNGLIAAGCWKRLRTQRW